MSTSMWDMERGKRVTKEKEGETEEQRRENKGESERDQEEKA